MAYVFRIEDPVLKDGEVPIGVDWENAPPWAGEQTDRDRFETWANVVFEDVAASCPSCKSDEWHLEIGCIVSLPTKNFPGKDLCLLPLVCPECGVTQFFSEKFIFDY